MSRLSVSHYVCPADYPIALFLAEASQIRAGAVALSVSALAEAPVRGLRAKLDDAGLRVSSLNSAGSMSYPEGPLWSDQDRRNRNLVEAAAELGAEVLCIITGGLSVAEASLEETRDRISERLADLHDFAVQHGVRLGLEPIHPAELMLKGCVNSIADALAMSDEIPGLHLILDHYHSWWDADLLGSFTNDLPRVALVQICNLREAAPGQMVDREVLSAGQIDCSALIRHAERNGYNGWYELEMFAHSLQGRRVPEVLATTAAAFAGLGVQSTKSQ